MQYLYKKITISIVIIYILAGCQNQNAKTPILDNPVCTAPCWQNITPGITTRQDFHKLIEAYQYFEQGSLHDYEEPWQGFDDLIRGRLKFNSDTITYFDAFFVDDKIVDMSFHGDWDTTLEQVMDKLGEPTNIVIINYGNDVFVKMIIPTEGVAFGYSTIDTPSSWQLEIQPDVEVSSIDFFAPDSYQKILDAELFSYGILDSNQTTKRMYTWTGYGNIEELYSPNTP